MLSKNELKYYASLKQKKQRLNKKLFLVEGLKQTQEALASEWTCELVMYTEVFKDDNSHFFRNIDPEVRVEEISERDLDKIADAKSPQGLISVFHQKLHDINSLNSQPIVFLEDVSDPGNLGTIIRSCDWFGFNQIILNENCVDLYNPKVVRSTMGSLFHLNIYEGVNSLDLLTSLKRIGYQILVADLDGISYRKVESMDKTVVVFCSESHGPSDELLKLADEKITIEQYGNAESLNVASAAAVILSEFALHNKPS